ncbi:putative nucleotidyltransferase [Desulfohalotomaculum tongense]|uniref:type VII toxin-antitoxin system MntA family adenylyltransferase antitoxin n=1 Tax=Desulforadius tongensis TaxID=1216062 RepID=UPI00195BF121|nr:putative nucleotidyltransferase [Desulforadius tongensis]
MNISEKEVELIKRYLVERVAPYLIILFGSAVKGNMRDESDVDIAFLSDKKFSAYDLFMIGQGLAGLLGRDVDLVDLEEVSTVFQVQVLGNGRIIYCTDEKKRIAFQMLALKKYARLNEERRRVIEKITMRGSVYE